MAPTTYKLDSGLNSLLVSVEPLLRDGEPRTDAEGNTLTVVSCVIPPEAGEKVQTIEVRVPANGVAKNLTPFGPVRFADMVLRTWEFKGRSGVTISASAVRSASAKGDA